MAALGEATETPERLWTAAMRAATAEEVAHLAEQAHAAQVSPSPLCPCSYNVPGVALIHIGLAAAEAAAPKNAAPQLVCHSQIGLLLKTRTRRAFWCVCTGSRSEGLGFA